MILHIHKEVIDSLSLLECATDLISNQNTKKFGKITAKDLLVYNIKKFNSGTQTKEVGTIVQNFHFNIIFTRRSHTYIKCSFVMLIILLLPLFSLLSFLGIFINMFYFFFWGGRQKPLLALWLLRPSL